MHLICAVGVWWMIFTWVVRIWSFCILLTA